MAKQRTIVGSPLTPELLKELGAVDIFPSTPRDFKPAEDWTNTYRIWTCHGYRESGNENVGFLRLKRIRESEKAFTLNVHEEVLQTDAMVGIIKGTISCRNNPLASPTRWNLSNRFIGADGEHIPELLSRNNGVPTEGTEKMTGDWCLFEAVQRLVFDKQTSINFNLLEGMSLRKSKHRLSYRGVHSVNTGTADTSLHCFVQTGSGILPYEYWLDARHRLLVVTTMNKAYILDEQAQEIFTQDVERARKSYRNKTSRRK
ncbi:hypothetical protein ACFL5Z_18490 [Planctomycetota bacterium]